MILVDTSVWIDHFRSDNSHLKRLLSDDEVLMHPSILGELTCGNFKNRKEILALLDALPKAVRAADEEVLQFIETRRLYGRGIGWIDAHLLLSCLFDRLTLWTKDRALQKLSRRLNLSST